MSPLNPQRSAAIRGLIEEFLRGRLNSKLDPLQPDDPKRVQWQRNFTLDVWLDAAASRAAQIQVATHSIKSMHPKAVGSSLYRPPSQLSLSRYVGTHALGSTYVIDAVGNAAALDVYSFLNLPYEKQSLLEMACSADVDLRAALSDDPKRAKERIEAFAAVGSHPGKPTSDSKAKQLYWMVDIDANNDNHFHLLAPLYPTSLVHRIYLQLQDDLFSDEAKAASAARKEGVYHSRAVHEYSDVAIQKIGGTKPQNISKLNAVRGGRSFLLASVPPIWKSVAVRPLLNVHSLFEVFGRRRTVRPWVDALRKFLEAKPPANVDTRRKVNAWVNELIDELLQFCAELQVLGPGWSTSGDCDLSTAQRAWLDPAIVREGVVAVDDVVDQVAEDFARWLNARLRDPLPVGDQEFLHWRRLAREQFSKLAREAM